MSWKPFDRVCVLLCEHVKSKAAAQAMDEARAEIGGISGGSDDDTAHPNGIDDILNEVCAEAGNESEESHEGAW